jgi:hypothetical protein
MDTPKTKELRKQIDKYLKINSKTGRFIMLMSKEQKKTLADFMIVNWNDLKKENPKYFIEENKKTTDIVRDSKTSEILQKVIKSKLALAAFYSKPFEDLEIFEYVETKEVYEPIPSN